jgi:hypothetical protein
MDVNSLVGVADGGVWIRLARERLEERGQRAGRIGRQAPAVGQIP